MQYARLKGIHVVHIREIDCPERSVWARWWSELNPGKTALALSAEPEDFAKEAPGEAVFIKHTYDAFWSTGIDAYLRGKAIKKLYFVSLTEHRDSLVGNRPTSLTARLVASAVRLSDKSVRDVHRQLGLLTRL